MMILIKKITEKNVLSDSIIHDPSKDQTVNISNTMWILISYTFKSSNLPSNFFFPFKEFTSFLKIFYYMLVVENNLSM